MSLFDDENEDNGYWYSPKDEFQQKVLRNAEKKGEHPLLYLAQRQRQAIGAMEEFIQQETLLSKNEQIAAESDVKEAEEALGRAYQVIPSSVVKDD